MEKKEIKGRNGGTLNPQVKGGEGIPGAGRKVNPFKEAIEIQAKGGLELRLKGKLVVDGIATEKVVEIEILENGVDAVVRKMFRKAARKGDVAAARWLSETGFGKTLVHEAGDDGGGKGSGFVIVLPPNNR